MRPLALVFIVAACGSAAPPVVSAPGPSNVAPAAPSTDLHVTVACAKDKCDWPLPLVTARADGDALAIDLDLPMSDPQLAQMTSPPHFTVGGMKCAIDPATEAPRGHDSPTCTMTPSPDADHATRVTLTTRTPLPAPPAPVVFAFDYTYCNADMCSIYQHARATVTR
ncbi:MAG TPA: hypothetical protein VL463_00210 [Kofleriaceae bacterium]|nr:hypothetical protein [Kofleriaceae bacterium]